MKIKQTYRSAQGAILFKSERKLFLQRGGQLGGIVIIIHVDLPDCTTYVWNYRHMLSKTHTRIHVRMYVCASILTMFYCRGTSGIDIDLRNVDIDQCPSPEGASLNIFADTDKCKETTTVNTHVSEMHDIFFVNIHVHVHVRISRVDPNCATAD